MRLSTLIAASLLTALMLSTTAQAAVKSPVTLAEQFVYLTGAFYGYGEYCHVPQATLDKYAESSGRAAALLLVKKDDRKRLAMLFTGAAEDTKSKGPADVKLTCDKVRLSIDNAIKFQPKPVHGAPK